MSLHAGTPRAAVVNIGTRETLAEAAARLSAAAAQPGTTAPPVSQRPAAVLVPLFEDETGTIRVVLTLRSSKLKSHSGEVCLPGGKADPQDDSLVATALREAHEEIRLPPDEAEIIMTLPPFLSKHKLSVTPVIAKILPHSRAAFACNEAEVEAIFDVPLDVFLTNNRKHWHEDVSWNDIVRYRLHYFKHNTFTIWGLTAAILIQAAQHVLQRQPDFVENLPGGPLFTDIFFDGQNVRLRTQMQAEPGSGST